MSRQAKITFIGAGSTTFMKNIVGDVLQREHFENAKIALMDIDGKHLAESEIVANRVIETLGVNPTLTAHLDQREALDGADFVVTAIQVGGYDPCTITDFDVPKKYGLRQTIADSIGVGGIMRGIRTVPHLWSVCEDMMQVCPEAILLQYVNPMAINTWAISRKFPKIKQVGLCHSVQNTAKVLCKDLGLDVANIRYRCAGINHISFFLNFEEILEQGGYRDLYPELQRGYSEGRFPRPESQEMPRCPNIVRYEILKQFGYFVTESSEHFAEYVPWFIKEGRDDLIDQFEIPLDEYIARCESKTEQWANESSDRTRGDKIDIKSTNEFASNIMSSVWTGEPCVINGNVPNTGLITNLPNGCAVEVPCLVDRNGIQPTYVGDLPKHLAAIMQSNVTAQDLAVEALIEEDPEFIFHSAAIDPHTSAELDLRQIRSLIEDMRRAHDEWLPVWARLQ